MGKTSKVGLAFALGLAAGWMASVFTSPETKQKAKKTIAEKTKKLKQILTDEDEQARIKDIFNQKTARATAVYMSAKQTVVANLSELKGQLEDIDTAKYKKAVKEALNVVSDKHKLPKNQLEKLKKYLESDYKKITVANKKPEQQ